MTHSEVLIFAKLADMLYRLYNIAPVRQHHSFGWDYGFDSLDGVEFVMHVEAEFDISLEDMEVNVTVLDLVKTVAKEVEKK